MSRYAPLALQNGALIARDPKRAGDAHAALRLLQAHAARTGPKMTDERVVAIAARRLMRG